MKSERHLGVANKDFVYSALKRHQDLVPCVVSTELDLLRVDLSFSLAWLEQHDDTAVRT